MSVFVVSPGHIDVLLHALSQYGIVAPDLDVESLRALGENLWHENFVSFNACGGDNVEVPHYELRTTDATLDPLAVLSAVDCYTQQSCEHPEWFHSDACALMQTLHAAVREQHPELDEKVSVSYGMTRRYRTLPAWDRIPWGFEELEEALLVPT